MAASDLTLKAELSLAAALELEAVGDIADALSKFDCDFAPELRKLLFQFCDALPDGLETVTVRSKRRSATGAGETLIRFELSNGLAELVGAIRASYRDIEIKRIGQGDSFRG